MCVIFVYTNRGRITSYDLSFDLKMQIRYLLDIGFSFFVTLLGDRL